MRRTIIATSALAALLMSSCSAQTADTTTPVDGEAFEQWPASVQALIPSGGPLSDRIVQDMVPFGHWDFVPGSALLITLYDQGHSIGRSGLIATIEPKGATDGEVMYCLHAFGYGGRLGATRCASDADQMASLLSFGFDLSGTCEPPIAQMLTVWGLPTSAIAFVVDLDDGDRVLVSPRKGVAIADWEGERSITSVRFDGDTPEQRTQLSSLTREEARISCP